MTRLRGAYDALQKAWPVATPPDALIDAMQSADRLGYHPENAKAEIEHFHMALIDAQRAVDRTQQNFADRLDNYGKHMSAGTLRSIDLQTEKKNRMDAVAKAVQLVQQADR